MQITPKVDDHEPIIVASSVEEAEQKRFGTEDRTVHAAFALLAEAGIVPAEREEITVQLINLGVTVTVRVVQFAEFECGRFI
jgi:hypothetical protein